MPHSLMVVYEGIRKVIKQKIRVIHYYKLDITGVCKNKCGVDFQRVADLTILADITEYLGEIFCGENPPKELFQKRLQVYAMLFMCNS